MKVNEIDEGWGPSSVLEILHITICVLRHVVNRKGSGHVLYFMNASEALHITIENGEVISVTSKHY